MRPTFSEFSYGFGISFEIENSVHSFSLHAPFLPSLVDEADKAFDVKFGLPGISLFLQFKRSDYLIRTSATEWADFNGPYFRFPIYPRWESLQHNNLVDLAAHEPHVYYCAPLFQSFADFNLYFLGNGVLNHSVFIPASTTPRLTDDDEHAIAYSRAGVGYFYSRERVLIKIFNADNKLRDLAADVSRGLLGEAGPITMARLQSLQRSMASIVQRNWEFLSIPEKEHLGSRQLPEFNGSVPNEIIRAIRTIARTHFGLEWIVISRKEAT